MPLRLAASENPVTILPLAGHTQSTLSSPSAGSGAGLGSTARDDRRRFGCGLGSARGDRRRRWLRRRCRRGAALDFAQRLLGIRLLDGLGLRLVGLGVARAGAGGAGAAGGSGRRRRAPRRRRVPGGGAVRTSALHAGGRGAGASVGRRQAQHLTHADHVEVLDVVPGRELAIVEAMVERDHLQRVAALHRVGRGPPIGLGRRLRRRRGDGRRRRDARGGGGGRGVRSSTGAGCRVAHAATHSSNQRNGRNERATPPRERTSMRRTFGRHR